MKEGDAVDPPLLRALLIKLTLYDLGHHNNQRTVAIFLGWFVTPFGLDPGLSYYSHRPISVLHPELTPTVILVKSAFNRRKQERKSDMQRSRLSGFRRSRVWNSGQRAVAKALH